MCHEGKQAVAPLPACRGCFEDLPGARLGKVGCGAACRAAKLCQVSGERGRGAGQADCGAVLEVMGHGPACAGRAVKSSGSRFWGKYFTFSFPLLQKVKVSRYSSQYKTSFYCSSSLCH